jgi:hypothetical protein
MVSCFTYAATSFQAGNLTFPCLGMGHLSVSFKLAETETALAFMDVGPIAKGREFAVIVSRRRSIHTLPSCRLSRHSKVYDWPTSTSSHDVSLINGCNTTQTMLPSSPTCLTSK